MAYLIQLLLPVNDNHHRAFPMSLHGKVKEELKDKFGGVTAYNRSAAEGLWNSGEQDFKDEILVYEVMIETVDLGWWDTYRRTLEQRFQQDEIVIRAMQMQRL